MDHDSTLQQQLSLLLQTQQQDLPWLQRICRQLAQQGRWSLLLALVQSKNWAEPQRSFAATVQVSALRRLGQHDAAIQLLQQMIQQGQSQDWHLLGLLQKEAGASDAARNSLRQAIAQNPASGASWWLLSDLNPNWTAAELATLRQQAASATTAEQQAFFYYSLHRALHMQQDYAGAFSALSQGAAAKKRALNYRLQPELAEFSRIPQQFSADLLQRQPPQPELGRECIFICGLPRSGTTLTEQILSAHSQVTAGDELYELARASEMVLNQRQLQLPFPDWANRLQDPDWQQLGQHYLNLTKPLQLKGLFTDKMPLNFKALGLIHKALPGAKLIWCRRDPLDTIWGCYRQLFDQGIGFSYDLDELYQYQQASDALMRYWQQQLGDKLLTLDYEQLVQDPHAQIRRLLAFCGLEAEAGCFEFHLNDRAVHTLSNQQVRQPLHQEGIKSWQPYAPYLQQLLAKFNP